MAFKTSYLVGALISKKCFTHKNFHQDEIVEQPSARLT